MATIISPASFAQTSVVTGTAFAFAEAQIRQELKEELSVLDGGIATLVGDLGGMGTDTLHITRFGGLGFAEQMVAMASETDAIVATGFTLEDDTITIARYGLAKEQTYQDQVLRGANSIGLENMIALAPKSWLATLRASVATVGSTFSANVGVSGTPWTYDDELDLVAAFSETEGFTGAMRPVSIRHPEQITDLLNSIRNEPGLQMPDFQTSKLGLDGRSSEAMEFLGIRTFRSFDVPTSGGDWIGCAFVPGAIAWAVASTIPITPDNPATTTWIPEFGIIIERKSTAETATARFVMNAWFGVGKLDPTLFPQFKLTSIND